MFHVFNCTRSLFHKKRSKNVYSRYFAFLYSQFLIFNDAVWLKSVLFKKILEKPSGTQNLQKLPQLINAKWRGSFCKFCVLNGFSRIFLNKTDFRGSLVVIVRPQNCIPLCTVMKPLSQTWVNFKILSSRRVDSL